MCPTTLDFIMYLLYTVKCLHNDGISSFHLEISVTMLYLKFILGLSEIKNCSAHCKHLKGIPVATNWPIRFVMLLKNQQLMEDWPWIVMTSHLLTSIKHNTGQQRNNQCNNIMMWVRNVWLACLLFRKLNNNQLDSLEKEMFSGLDRLRILWVALLAGNIELTIFLFFAAQ